MTEWVKEWINSILVRHESVSVGCSSVRMGLYDHGDDSIESRNEFFVRLETPEGAYVDEVRIHSDAELDYLEIKKSITVVLHSEMNNLDAIRDSVFATNMSLAV